MFFVVQWTAVDPIWCSTDTYEVNLDRNHGIRHLCVSTGGISSKVKNDSSFSVSRVKILGAAGRNHRRDIGRERSVSARGIVLVCTIEKP